VNKKLVRLSGLVLLGLLSGYFAGTCLRSAEAKVTSPAFAVGINGVNVHRFADVYEGGAVLCYVATMREHFASSISCVKR
jgi:hypothetical protein